MVSGSHEGKAQVGAKKMRRLVVLLAVAFASSAGATYKCVDAKGVTYVGDTPPEACGNVVMYEVNSNGTVIRKIDPTPTPEQAKANKEEAEKRKEAERAAAEQKRKDLALLASFSTEREFDVARERNIEPLMGRIKNARDRIAAVDKRIKEIEDEMEFYKAGKGKAAKPREPPPVLTIQLDQSRAEKELLEKSIATNEREIVTLKAKFDSDKARWMALKADPGLRNQEAAPVKAAVAGTLIPGVAKCGTQVYECQAGQTYTCRRSDGLVYRVNCVVERK
jgi:hypothetical protein